MRQTRALAALLSSRSHEWFTPARYVEAAREVLGTIDLDPASCEGANATVGAVRFFDAHTDGLAHDWPGRVWLNPPYGRLGPQFVAKLLEQHRASITTAAILLVAPHTSAAWFQPLFGFPLCFTNHRIKFIGGGDAPTQSNVFAYLGPRAQCFGAVFRRFGSVMVPAPSYPI
jgi:hypothetical protein